jgi:hypothetical protein
MLFQLKKLPGIINLIRFLKSFWILYIDQIIVYNAFYSKLTFYIIKDRCQIHALKVFRSPVWLLLHTLSSPHYRYIRKMRHGDRLPLTQVKPNVHISCNNTLVLIVNGAINPKGSNNVAILLRKLSLVNLKLTSGGLALNVNMSLSAYHNTPNIFILKALLMLCPLVNYIVERYSINLHT